MNGFPLFAAVHRFWMLRRLGNSGSYQPVQSLRFYYEIYGHGEPVMMFHGGLSTLETFRFQIPELSRHYRLILPERRGHGHTADTPDFYSYEQMADEMAAFMKKRGIGKSGMVGYSDGANLMFYMALKYPELTGPLVFIGGNFHHEGCTEEHRREIQSIPDGSVGTEGIDERYARYSPDGPEHYAVVFQKLRKLWLTEPTFKPSDLKGIETPVLIIAGDHDVIRLEHTLEFYHAFKYAKLLIVPGATHRVIKENPDLVNRAILGFFKNPKWSEPEKV